MHYTLFLILSLLLQHLNAALAPRRIECVEPHTLARQAQDQWSKASSRFIVVDNDGVLVPRKGAKEEDYERARGILETMTSDPKNQVWVISLRGIEHLKGKYADVKNLNLAGSSGLDIFSKVDGIKPLENVSRDVNSLLKDIAAALERQNYQVKYSKNAEPGSFMHFRGSIVYVFGDNTSMNEEVQRLMKNKANNSFDYESLLNSEDRTTVSLTHHKNSKGAFVENLLKVYSKELNENSFVISMGDQMVDESMHRVVNSLNVNSKFSVFINDQKQETIATTRLRNHHEVLKFWESLTSSGASTS